MKQEFVPELVPLGADLDLVEALSKFLNPMSVYDDAWELAVGRSPVHVCRGGVVW